MHVPRNFYSLTNQRIRIQGHRQFLQLLKLNSFHMTDFQSTSNLRSRAAAQERKAVVLRIADDTKTCNTLIKRAAKSRNQPVRSQDLTEINRIRVDISVIWKTGKDASPAVEPMNATHLAYLVADTLQEIKVM